MAKPQELSPAIHKRITEIQNRFPTFSAFLDRFRPQNQTVGAQHPALCVTSGTAPTLTYINLTYGEGKAIAWLVIHLTYFQEQINIPNKMTAYQLETCAQAIHERYYFLKASELMLFFARLTGGMYNVDWHGYITPDKILSALKEHFMPWRNELLYRLENEERERRENEEKRRWEEYKRKRNGKDIQAITCHRPQTRDERDRETPTVLGGHTDGKTREETL